MEKRSTICTPPWLTSACTASTDWSTIDCTTSLTIVTSTTHSSQIFKPLYGLRPNNDQPNAQPKIFRSHLDQLHLDTRLFRGQILHKHIGRLLLFLQLNTSSASLLTFANFDSCASPSTWPSRSRESAYQRPDPSAILDENSSRQILAISRTV